jgi:N-acetylglucosaminyldiphosphoundecaprenol N-acetyl-beta-D-mannosaminyltransferase
VIRARRVLEHLHLSKKPRVDLFGVQIDQARMDEVVATIFDWVQKPADHCRYVVTPNVDHTVMLQDNDRLVTAYRAADLVLPDGFPVVVASWFLGKGLPERVPGSDLVPALFKAAGDGETLRVFLLGAAPGVAVRAAERIHRKWPSVKVVDVYSPPPGFEHDEAECGHILAQIERARPDLLVVGLGAPKQEIWVHHHREALAATVVLCVGATIDFLAGERFRAPRWMQRFGLEWLFRLLSEPKRLAGRYARDAWIFPQLVWREWRSFAHRPAPVESYNMASDGADRAPLLSPSLSNSNAVRPEK